MRRGDRTKLGTMQITEFDKARFWSQVDVPRKLAKFDGGRCWPWLGAHVEHRGQFVIRGTKYYAPRISWMLFVGPIHPGLFVCHICDNPACVNPKHLFTGTASENQTDCARKGRKRGKLTPTIVRAVRKECIPSDPEFGYSALARKYGCNPGAIWNAANKTRWKWVS